MTENTITEKQKSYLTALIAERDETIPVVASIKKILEAGALDKLGASQCISVALSLPKKSKKSAAVLTEKVYYNAPASTEEASTEEAPLSPYITVHDDGVTSVVPGVYDVKPYLADPVHGVALGKYVVVSPYNPKGYYTKQQAKLLVNNYSNKSGIGTMKYSTWALKNLVKAGNAELIDANAVGNLGKALGVCMCCAATLSDPVSVANGIGPICAKKYGYA